MTIWGVIGFMLMMATGAYFYYRALAEIRGQKAEEDEKAFEDDTLLSEIRPFVATFMGRPMALLDGFDLVLKAGDAETFELERISLPIRSTRGLHHNIRRIFHTYQLLAMAVQLKHSKFLTGKNWRWHDIDQLEKMVVAEWPGVGSYMGTLKKYETDDCKLYPIFQIKYLEALVPGENEVVHQPKGNESRSPVQRKTDVYSDLPARRTQNRRGLSIERVETEQDTTRIWHGEERDERSGQANELPQEAPILVSSSTPVADVVQLHSKPTHSVNQNIRDLYCYDEWDCFEGRYRRNYCSVLVETPTHDRERSDGILQALESKRQIVQEVVRLFQSLRPIPRRMRRQADGDSIDVDAYVDSFVERLKRKSASDALYERTEKHERSVSVSLLLDLSASTERWVGKRRAFEVGLETAAIFALGEKTLDDEVEILGFSSRGPHQIRITQFKSFNEAWTDDLWDRMSLVGPQEFTRLGAAIRHAGKSLHQRKSRKKLLLLLSDAKPQDEDGYEGQYAWGDTRKALDEVRLLGIRPFCLTLDPDSRPLLRLLFRDQYAIHLEPETLSRRLPKIFSELTRDA